MNLFGVKIMNPKFSCFSFYISEKRNKTKFEFRSLIINLAKWIIMKDVPAWELRLMHYDYIKENTRE